MTLLGISEEIDSQLANALLDLMNQHFKDINPNISKLATPGSAERKQQEEFALAVLKVAEKENVDPLLLLNLAATESTLGLDKGKIGNAFQVFASTWKSATDYFKTHKYLFEDGKVPDIMYKTHDEIKGNTELEIEMGIWTLKYSTMAALSKVGLDYSNKDSVKYAFNYINNAFSDPTNEKYSNVVKLGMGSYRTGSGTLFNTDAGKAFNKNVKISEDSKSGNMDDFFNKLDKGLDEYKEIFDVVASDGKETVNEYYEKTTPKNSERELYAQFKQEMEIQVAQAQQQLEEERKRAEEFIKPIPEKITTDVEQFLVPLGPVTLTPEAATTSKPVPSPKLPGMVRESPEDILEEVMKEPVMEAPIIQPQAVADKLLLSAVEEPKTAEKPEVPIVVEQPTPVIPLAEEDWRSKIGVVIGVHPTKKADTVTKRSHANMEFF